MEVTRQLTDAVRGLVDHVRRKRRLGPSGSLTRLVFRLLEDDETFVAPIAARMQIETDNVVELVAAIEAAGRRHEALDLLADPAQGVCG